MEIIVSDERDSRFIEFCNSFGILSSEPQVVLLVKNYEKIIACASFKIYDSISCEIANLFVEGKNQEEIAYKLLKQLEKIAIDYEFENIIVFIDCDDNLNLNLFKKLDYDVIDNSENIKLKKSLRSLI